jgi:membrane protease YdiL (CAAX protease family)
MKNNTNVSESVLGWFYLFFHVFLLSPLAHWLNTQLPAAMNESWLSLFSYGFSFLILVMIFHAFLTTAAGNASKNGPQWLRAVALGFCIYYTSSAMMDLFLPNWFSEYKQISNATLISLMKLEFLPMVIGVVVLVPFVEEILYRGIMFRTLFNWNKTAGYVAAIVIYAGIHIMAYANESDPFTLFVYFLQFLPAGFTLAWTYANSDNIFAPIVIHIIINAMGVFSMR